MLHTLKIRNYALIRELELQFSEGLSVITGETGAGKSILLGALGLILGKRADKKVLWDLETKCIVEGSFNIKSYQLQAWFEQHDLDYEANSVLRREINKAGKSRAFINDTPVRLDQMQELGRQLIHIHSQHETLDIAQSGFQTQVLDAMSGSELLLKRYQKSYRQYLELQKQLDERRKAHQEALAEQDYLQFQVSELQEANLDDLDLESLEAELQRSEYAEQIKEKLFQASQCFQADQGPGAALEAIRDAAQHVQQASRWNPELEELLRRLESLEIEAEDLYSELQRRSDNLEWDPERSESLRTRVDQVNRLLHKHGKQQVTELQELEQSWSEKLNYSLDEGGALDELEKEISVLRESCLNQGQKLREKRQRNIAGLCKSVSKGLAEVGMLQAQLEVKMEALPEMGMLGLDRIKFLFAPNKGSRFEDLGKIASGGEMSRLMLVIKSLLAGKLAWPSLIFDEIDTGVSGQTGMSLGTLLSKLAARHQVITITHLPQIAAAGKQHYVVYKKDDKQSSSSEVRLIEGDDRVDWIARMLSGDPPADSALANASDLLKLQKVD